MINDEYRHTSLLSTLRKVWDLGDPFSDRDAAARTFDHLLSRESPRDPGSWPDVHPRPVPEWQLTKVELGQALSPLGKAIGPGMVEHAKQAGLPVGLQVVGPRHREDLVLGAAAVYEHAHPWPRHCPPLP